MEENNSKESNEDSNASKIPKSEFNRNNLKELLNKDNSNYFSQTDENDIMINSNLISLPNQINQKNNKLNNNFNDLKDFNSNDNSFTKTFSPKNNNSNRMNINYNNFALYNANSSKFPKIPEKYSDIASILKKDINETIKKEKEMFENDKAARKNSSLSNNLCKISNICSINTGNLIIIPEKKQEEKKVHKLNLNDILSANSNKEEYFIITFSI